MEVHGTKLPGGADPRAERDHAGNGEVNVAVLVEGLDPGEAIDAGVVGNHTAIHIVVALCEVHGSGRGVASNLPNQLYRRIIETALAYVRSLQHSSTVEPQLSGPRLSGMAI